jgi:hypothetical protein
MFEKKIIYIYKLVVQEIKLYGYGNMIQVKKTMNFHVVLY